MSLAAASCSRHSSGTPVLVLARALRHGCIGTWHSDGDLTPQLSC